MKKHDKATEDQSENFGCKYFSEHEKYIKCLFEKCKSLIS